MSAIDDDIAAFDSMRPKLESEHLGEWILMRNREVIGFHPTFEAAASEAVRMFGRGPYLIRQIGAEPLRFPVSVMYHRYAD